MPTTFKQKILPYADWAAEIIQKRAPNFRPKLAFILGSGLGAVAQQMTDHITIPFDELPNFSVSKVLGHAKNLHLGYLHKVPVVCFDGRTHLYEGENALEVVKTMIRAVKLLGCEILFTTCAVGSTNLDIKAGDLVAITDHINFTFANPLIGPNDERFGDRFCTMDNAYDKDLREKVKIIAKKNNIPITEGVYLAASGPSFETHAEIRAYKMLGADVVGMSNVPEVIVARHCGIKVASVCAVTNLAAGLNPEPLSHEVTLRGAKLGVEKLSKLILAFIAEVGNEH
jgi:xanthosine phosphorylase